MTTYDEIINILKEHEIYAVKEVHKQFKPHRSYYDRKDLWLIKTKETITGLSFFCAGILIDEYEHKVREILKDYPVVVTSDRNKEEIYLVIKNSATI